MVTYEVICHYMLSFIHEKREFIIIGPLLLTDKERLMLYIIFYQ